MTPDEKPRDFQDPDPEEAEVGRFMEGSVRASHFADLCEALALRIRGMREEMTRLSPSPERDHLEVRIREAKRQIAILRQEQAVSQFVEESVRATLHNAPIDFDDEEFG